MITKLTKEQELQIPIYIEKWINKASEPINKDDAVRITKELFGNDKTILIADSVQNGIDIIRLIAGGKKIKHDSQLDSQLRSQLYSQLSSQLYSQLYSQLDSQLRSQLYSQLYSQLDSQLRSQLRSQLYSQLDSQLYSQLRSENISYSCYTTLWWYGWYGYYDFAKSIGVQFDEEKFNRMGEIILNIPLIITLGSILIVVDKPKCLWNNGRLHSEIRPAIEWKDGTGIYFLNAVRFEKDLWEKVVTKKIAPKEILEIKDIDQRTQAMKFLPAKDFLKAVNAELLDKSKRGNELYKIPQGLFTIDAYYTYYKCPSTGNEYLHGIDPEFAAKSRNADECVAWMYHLSKDAYKQLAVEA